MWPRIDYIITRPTNQRSLFHRPRYYIIIAHQGLCSVRFSSYHILYHVWDATNFNFLNWTLNRNICDLELAVNHLRYTKSYTQTKGRLFICLFLFCFAFKKREEGCFFPPSPFHFISLSLFLGMELVTLTNARGGCSTWYKHTRMFTVTDKLYRRSQILPQPLTSGCWHCSLRVNFCFPTHLIMLSAFLLFTNTAITTATTKPLLL